MNNLKQSIGILGGTFDPVHWGHLSIAEQVFSKLNLQNIRFIPCFKPALRREPIASPEQRVTMLKLALKNQLHFILDEREIKRKGTSYMIDTLQSLREEFPQTPLCLILGADAFNRFPRWHQFQKILDYAHLIIINRSSLTEFSSEIQKLIQENKTESVNELHQTLNGKIYFFKILPIEISASKIREKIQHHEKVADYLSPAVNQFIQEKQLYKPND